MRATFLAAMATGVALLTACQQELMPNDVARDTGPAPTAAAIERAIARWPREAKRPVSLLLITGKVQVAGKGFLELHTPYDFRLRVAGPGGEAVLDAKYNWAGITILAKAREISTETGRAVMGDLSLALRMPESAAGAEMKDRRAVLRHTDAATNKFTWQFGSGGVRAAEIEVGAFDKIVVRWLDYSDAAWPGEMVMTHGARHYTLWLVFEDVESKWRVMKD